MTGSYGRSVAPVAGRLLKTRPDGWLLNSRELSTMQTVYQIRTLPNRARRTYNGPTLLVASPMFPRRKDAEAWAAGKGIKGLPVRAFIERADDAK